MKKNQASPMSARALGSLEPENFVPALIFELLLCLDAGLTVDAVAFQNQLEIKSRQLEAVTSKLKKAEKDLEDLENVAPNAFAAPSTPARKGFGPMITPQKKGARFM